MATARNIEAMYVEWRRVLRTGTRRRQEASIAREAETELFRWYEPVLIPGILHTAEYAAAVLTRIISFYEVPDDLEAGVAARMERQQILYRGHHRFHFIVAEQALRTRVGSTGTMIGQVDRLLTVLSLPRVSFGIVPTRAEYRVPTNQFIVFDDRVVHVENLSAEVAVTQPREIALYAKAFHELSELTVYGRAARELIEAALIELRRASHQLPTSSRSDRAAHAAGAVFAVPVGVRVGQVLLVVAVSLGPYFQQRAGRQGFEFPAAPHPASRPVVLLGFLGVGLWGASGLRPAVILDWSWWMWWPVACWVVGLGSGAWSTGSWGVLRRGRVGGRLVLGGLPSWWVLAALL